LTLESARPAIRPAPSPRIALRCLESIRLDAPSFSQGRVARVPIHLVAHDGMRAGFELQWRYPSGTFDDQPGAPNWANLFTLAALIPILNYLPFCRKIEVGGPLEVFDAEWISRLARATAREILRLKLTPDNPFLRSEVLPLVAAEKLDPPAIQPNAPRLAAPRWTSDERRSAVIQNGSPESLLTWAILNEVRLQPLAVFLEYATQGMGAGANAWRHLSTRLPGQTLSVWSNLPLLFGFFLKHLDFLKPNYQSLHLDMTPLRIFEFEVEILAMLPLLWSRGVRHIVMPHRSEGAERRQFSGAIAAQPPFEQTRAFDDFMTRVFARKGWNLEQWTLLRPASPIIIQRMLGARYPDLFPLQVDCRHPRLEAPPRPLRVERPPAGGDEAEEEELAEGGEDEESPWGARESDWETRATLRAADGRDEDEEEGERMENGRASPTDRERPGDEKSRKAAGNGISENAFALATGDREEWESRAGRWRAVPCGVCEVCRRQVAILTALGLDPKDLGYGPAKIERALAHTWRVSNLPPEARVQRHVLYLLQRARGVPPKLDDSATATATATASAASASQAQIAPPAPSSGPHFEFCPEVEALRFDTARTSIDAIPLNVRRDIYRVLLEHSSGAVRREARGNWTPFDLMKDPEIDAPKILRDADFPE